MTVSYCQNRSSDHYESAQALYVGGELGMRGRDVLRPKVVADFDVVDQDECDDRKDHHHCENVSLST